MCRQNLPQSAAMEAKLAAMRSGKVALVSPETKAADEALAVALFDEWTRRRRIFRDVYDSLLESSDKKPAQLKEEVRSEAALACVARQTSVVGCRLRCLFLRICPPDATARLQIGIEDDADVGLDYAACKTAMDVLSKQLQQAAFARKKAEQAAGVGR